jgi:hypothetical protein
MPRREKGSVLYVVYNRDQCVENQEEHRGMKDEGEVAVACVVNEGVPITPVRPGLLWCK